MSSNTEDLLLYSAIGFCFGVFAFFKGFWIFRKYRVLADTPESSIRSIAMGLVQIHGVTKGADFVFSPLTATRCFFYQVTIERYREHEGRGEESMVSLVVSTAIDHSTARWHTVKTVSDGVRFYLQDKTGKVLVDARGAELDLIETGQWEQQKPGGTFATAVLRQGARVPSDDMLRNYAASQGVSSSPAALRLTESCVLRSQSLSVIGTCTENPKPSDDGDRNLIVRGNNELTFLITWDSEKSTADALRRSAALHIFGGGSLSVACLSILIWKLGWL